MSDFLMCYNLVSVHLAQVNSQLSLAWTYTGIRAVCWKHHIEAGWGMHRDEGIITMTKVNL